MQDHVTLNVGGRVFENIPFQNLRKSPVFDAQITNWDNDAAKKDESGNICLNRDPTIFALILQYLESENKELKFDSDKIEQDFLMELDELCIPTYEERVLEVFQTAPPV